MLGRVHLVAYSALVAVIVALVVYIRGLWFIEGLEQKLEACRATVIQLGAEGDKAVAVSTTIAREGDRDHAENLSITTVAARRFIERNRLQSQVSYPAGSTAALPSGTGPTPTVPELDPRGDPSSVPEAPRELAAGWVAIKEEDVLVCTAVYEFAWTAHNFIQDAEEAGLMRPAASVLPEPALSLEPQPPQ